MQTINNYQGDNRSCLVSNCLFRMGGAASIISNVYVCCTAHAAQAAPGVEERDQQRRALIDMPSGPAGGQTGARPSTSWWMWCVATWGLTMASSMQSGMSRAEKGIAVPQDLCMLQRQQRTYSLLC